MRSKSYLFLLVLFLGSFSSYSQSNCSLKLSGTIRDKDTHETIPLATIELLNTEMRVVADEEGKFLIKNVCLGTYTMLVRFVGYQNYQQEITINQTQQIEVLMQEEVTSLSEVTVEGKRAEEIATLHSVELNQEELFKRGGESLGKSLLGIAGVNIMQTGPNIAKPVIQGLHSNRILILNNGIRQEGQQWGQEHAPEIDPFVATNLKLIKGAAAVKYGSDAIGGVILVNPPDLPESGPISGALNFVGNSNNGLYTSSALVEGGVEGVKGLGWRVQGSYKKAGDSRAANYRLTNTGTSEKNFSLGLGYHKENLGVELFFSSFNAEIGILRSAHIGNLADLEKAIGSDRPLYISDFSYDINNPKQAIEHQLLKVNAHYDAPNIGKFSIQYGLQNNQRDEYDIRRGGRSQIPALSLQLITHTLELDLDMAPQGDFKGDVGASFLYQGNSNNPQTGIAPLIPNFDNMTAGMHAIGRYIQDNYELELGVRYDFKHYLVKRFDAQNNLVKPEYDFHNVTGSAGAVFFLNSDWSFRTNVGTAWRAPHINELYSGGLHHGSASIEEGNQDLISEKAIKWINSLEHVSDKYTLDVSAYYNSINDYIYLRPEDVTLTIQGAFPLLRYTQTDASFLGFDADLDYHLNQKMDIGSKMSYLRAKDRVNGGPLINIPANRIQLSYTYHFTEGALKEPFISLNTDVVDRQRNAPRVVTIAEIREADEQERDIFEGDATVFDILAAPPGYVNFGINGGFKVPISGNPLSVFISVENLFNNEYRDYMNRLRYYTDEVGRSFNLKLNYTF